MNGKLLVTGASGNLGRLVIGHLLDTFDVPAKNVIAGSRDTSKIADLAARGIETRRVDFEDPVSLSGAFEGIDRLLIISTDAIDGSGTRLRQHKAAVDAAKKAGVGRIFYTSMPSADDNRITFGPDHYQTEEAIKATGIPYTIFRNGWYMENLFMALPQALASGQWYSAAGDGRIAHVARDDIARAIAAGISSEPNGSTTWTLTGEKTHSTEEIAALVREVSGKPLSVVHVSDEQLAGGMAAAGVPEPFIPTFVSFDTNTREGKIAMATGDVEKLSGKKPVSLKTFLQASTDALGA